MARRTPAIGRQWTQRRYRRYPVDAQLRMHIFLDEDCTMLVHGRCHELGRGGLGVMLSTQLRSGESVWLETMAFRGYATVRYNKGWYHGLEFTLLRQNDRARVDTLCDSLSRGPEPERVEPFSCGSN